VLPERPFAQVLQMCVREARWAGFAANRFE
jgi:hypothetical protein